MLELNRIRSPVSSSTGLSVTRGLDHHGARLDSDVALAGGRCARPAARRARRSRRRTTRRTRRLRPSAPPGRRSPPRRLRQFTHRTAVTKFHSERDILRSRRHASRPSLGISTSPSRGGRRTRRGCGCREPPLLAGGGPVGCRRAVEAYRSSPSRGGRRRRGRARASGRVVRAAFGASAERSARKSVVPVIDLWSSDG